MLPKSRSELPREATVAASVAALGVGSWTRRSAAAEQLRASDIFAPLLLLGRTVRLVEGVDVSHGCWRWCSG
jgi:hypothetical protein